MFARVSTGLANAKEIVEDTQKVSEENTVISEAGKVPVTAPLAIDEYGAIAYSYNPASTAYVMYATGTKGKQAIVVASESNRGK
jgi:hypothetical protein